MSSPWSPPDQADVAPRLRLEALDVFPVEDSGRKLFCMRDRTEPRAEPIFVSQGAVMLATLLDGTRTIGQVRAAFALRTGASLQDAEIQQFITTLDKANLLASVRFLEQQEQERQEFLAQLERPAVHAGGAYPGTRTELEPFLQRFYDHVDGPGAAPGPVGETFVQGLIAPHIDLHRGGATYAWTYKALAESQPAELYVLLGTCHTSMSAPLAMTREAYATPLGPAPLDTDFADRLESLFPGDLYQAELSHRTEHSLEFQAVYLRHLERVGGGGPGKIVPILCGSLHEWVVEGGSPADTAAVADSVAALREALAQTGKRVCLVAGADLAHVGPQFGDRAPITSARLSEVSGAIARCSTLSVGAMLKASTSTSCRMAMLGGSAGCPDLLPPLVDRLRYRTAHQIQPVGR